jgi:hypothetical protein
MTGGDLHQDRPRAAAGFEQPLARPWRDGGGQKGGVHAGAITPRGLSQTHAPAQQGVLDDFRRGGNAVQASISLTLRGVITIVRAIAIRQADAVGISCATDVA